MESFDDHSLGLGWFMFFSFAFQTLRFSSAYAEVWPGSFLGDIEGIFHLKLIIHVLV